MGEIAADGLRRQSGKSKLNINWYRVIREKGINCNFFKKKIDQLQS
jgi:hypothetical protein